MITVVIPLFNKETTIVKTIKSILKQKNQDYEIVVVDDGSTDNGPELIHRLHSDKITLFRQENKGPSAARNMGVKKAKGEWIVFMDADDWFEPDAFNHFQTLIDNYSDCHFFCCNYFIERNGEKHIFTDRYKDGSVKNNFFAWCAGICMPRAGAALYRKEILLQHPFNEELHRYEDAEALFSIMRSTPIVRSSKPVMTYNCNCPTASLPCKDIAKDFIGHLSFIGKSFWECYALFQLYKQGMELYPNEMSNLYKFSMLQRIEYKCADIIIGKMKKFKII